MADQEDSLEEQEAARSRRTLKLLLAGVAALLLPLLGAAYIYFNSSDGPPAADLGMTSVFEKRQGRVPLAPSQSAAPMTTKGGLTGTSLETLNSPDRSAGSLGFITGGEDYKYQPKPQQAQVPSPPVESKVEKPAAQAPAETVPAPTAGKTVSGKKPFNPPKLQPMSRGTFAGSSLGAKNSAQASGGDGAPEMPPGMDINKMMQGGGIPGMPPGMDMNKLMQGAPGAQVGSGMPDMNKLMQNMPKGSGGAPIGGQPSQ